MLNLCFIYEQMVNFIHYNQPYCLYNEWMTVAEMCSSFSPLRCQHQIAQVSALIGQSCIDSLHTQMYKLPTIYFYQFVISTTNGLVQKNVIISYLYLMMFKKYKTKYMYKNTFLREENLSLYHWAPESNPFCRSSLHL